jgi:hypothetical protein
LHDRSRLGPPPRQEFIDAVNSSLSIRAEDGVIWVYSLGDDGVMAFTDFGIENVELAKIRKNQKPRQGRRDLV